MKARFVILGLVAAVGAGACDGLLGIVELDGGAPADAGSDALLVESGAGDAAPDARPGDGSFDAPDEGSFDAPDDADAASEADIRPSCFPLPSGIVSWWRAEGTAVDTVGPNNGTATNVTYPNGVVGRAFHFAGDGDILAGAVGLPTGADDRTIEMWVRIAVTYAGPAYTEGVFLSYGAHGVSNSTYSLLVAAAGADNLAPDTLSFSQWGQLLPSRPLSENDWHHIAATLANGTLGLYLDGSPVTTQKGGLQITTAAGGSVVMGGLPPPLNGNSISGWLTGDLDEAAAYARALRPDEIQGIFAAGGLGKCP